MGGAYCFSSAWRPFPSPEGAFASQRAKRSRSASLLPDTKSSVRWVQFDCPPDFAKALKAARGDVLDHQRSQRPDPSRRRRPRLAWRPVRRSSSRPPSTTAPQPRSSFCPPRQQLRHRLRPPGDRRLGVDLRHLRRQEGRRGPGQRHHRRDEGKRHVQGVEHGCRALRRPDRSERLLVQERQRRRLQPALRGRQAEEGAEQFVPDWDATNAATIFAQMLVKTNSNIQAVMAANDNIAGAVVADAQGQGPEAGRPAQPGRDCPGRPVHPCQVKSEELGAVYKYVPLEVNAATSAAIAPFCTARSRTRTRSSRTARRRNRPMRRSPWSGSTKKNYTQLFTQGFLKKSEVCIGAYKQYC